MTSSVWKISIREPSWVITGCIFLYFLTLSGDLLEIPCFGIPIKLSRVFACFLFLILFLSNRFQLIEKKLFLCFLWIFSAFFISTLFSAQPLRSLAACGAGVMAYTCFFLVPLNLMFLYDRHKILRLYFLSFALVGLHALAQVVLSFFDIYDPFVLQVTPGNIVIARGQSWTYEPSFYALFAIPFVSFLNCRFLLKENISLWKILGANLLLLASTSTGGFFSYFLFFAVTTALSFFWKHFSYLRARSIYYLLAFTLCFGGISLLFIEIFLGTFYKFFHIGFLAHWSFAERWEKIVLGWDVFCSSPLFGVGLRGFEAHAYLMDHFDNPHVAFHEHVDVQTLLTNYVSTNVFMEILSSLGIYGLCTFLFLALIIWQLFSSAIADPRLPLAERKIFFAFFVSILVMILCLQFNQELFRNYVWAHMGISIGYLLRTKAIYTQMNAKVGFWPRQLGSKF